MGTQGKSYIRSSLNGMTLPAHVQSPTQQVCVPPGGFGADSLRMHVLTDIRLKFTATIQPARLKE